MSCDRCVDIHNGQMCGSNNKPCMCDCHGNSFYPVWCNGTIDPTYGIGTTVTTCDSSGCSVINLNNE
jgi:hypothetical protein